MKFLQKSESMYIVDEQQIIDFKALLQSHRYLSNYLYDFKHGYSFQLQIAFDLHLFLTTDQRLLYPNVYCNLEHPLHAYIHELLSRQFDFKHFKMLHSNNELLALIISVFVTKKVIAIIKSEVIDTDPLLKYNNPLALVIQIDDVTSEEPPINLTIQRYLLTKMKQLQMNFHYFEPIVASAIKSAKELELLLRKEFIR